MSGAIGSAVSSYGLLGTLLANSGTIRQQLDTLTVQASNGLIANTYAGLGSGAGVSLNLNPQVASLQNAQTNISAATGRMAVTQNAMTQIQQIAANFTSKMPNLNGLNPQEIDSVAADARDALGQVADLLNTKDGNNYVFSGQDTGNPPVPSASTILTSPFYTQINSAVSGLSIYGAAGTAAATLQAASSDDPATTPFSAYLSQPAGSVAGLTVDTGDGTTAQTGLLANANAAVVSAGSSTTGSYMRDLMRSLATLGSMTSAQATDPEFAGLVEDTRGSLNGVVTAMAGDVGVLGDRQAALTNQQTSMAATVSALTTQISSAQDVDMAATLSKLTSTQTQLQASYKVISAENSMSLVNFLPA